MRGFVIMELVLSELVTACFFITQVYYNTLNLVGPVSVPGHSSWVP